MLVCIHSSDTIHPFLLRSSVAFLAVPGLVDVAQFLIIVSIGLSLGSVVMGFNSEVDEKLSDLQYITHQLPLYVTTPGFTSPANLGQNAEKETRN